MENEKIKTFNQYVDEKHREIAQKYNISLAEAGREMPRTIYQAQWRDYVVASFLAGLDIPTYLWRSMDKALQDRILRSSRALRSDSLTRELRKMI